MTNMLGNIPHQFFFYHLPTRGRTVIKLGDAENTFFRIELDVVCSEVVEFEPQVIYQRVDMFGFDDHIIYVCLYCFADLFL